MENLGEQSPIKLKFEVGVSLKELKLGEVDIKEFDLNLPEKIEIGDISGIKDYKIPLPELIIEFPPTPINDLESFSLDSIVFHPPSPVLPTLPLGDFSCPELNPGNYQCIEQEQNAPNYYTDFEWYVQTFSWLLEKCQEIPTMTDDYGAPKQECFA